MKKHVKLSQEILHCELQGTCRNCLPGSYSKQITDEFGKTAICQPCGRGHGHAKSQFDFMMKNCMNCSSEQMIRLYRDAEATSISTVSIQDRKESIFLQSPFFCPFSGDLEP